MDRWDVCTHRKPGPVLPMDFWMDDFARSWKALPIRVVMPAEAGIQQ